MRDFGVYVAALFAIQPSQTFSRFGAPYSMNNAISSCRFPYIHSDIVSILECPFSEHDSVETAAPASSILTVDRESLKIVREPSCSSGDALLPVSTLQLVKLAYVSDNALYESSWTVLESTSLQSLVDLGSKNGTSLVAATLLALNRLESAIRRATGHATGKAPLLKHMVLQLDNKNLACILMTLLLPTGLNLRNLLWHGFCAANLPRHWLSLVLVLTYNLETNPSDDETQFIKLKDDGTSLMDMMKRPSVRALLGTSRSDSESLAILKHWLPESHYELLELAFSWKATKPMSSVALLSVILEHGLRLDWCRLNDSLESAIARPGAYYVTLDGHGQKHQHDLILYPFVGEDHRENKLIAYLGGSTVALLTDLYASSSGGPNLRASLAHGLWDAQLQYELNLDTTSQVNPQNKELLEMVTLLIVAMEGAALSPRPELRQYQPIYSYRAVTLRNLDEVLNLLHRLSSLQASMTTMKMMYNEHIARLNVQGFEDMAARNKIMLRISSGEWTAEHVFQEYQLNAALADFGATQSLLEDVAVATMSFACKLDEAQSVLRAEENTLDRRQLKSLQRVCYFSDIVVTMYRFAALVALLSLEHALYRELKTDNKGADEWKLPPEILLKAVERSRMCISTFSNFLTTNTDRSLKAAVDYTKGKAIKAVIEYIERALGVND